MVSRRSFFGGMFAALGIGGAAYARCDYSRADCDERGVREGQRVIRIGPVSVDFDHGPRLQAAIDLMESIGGGTVEVEPGEYSLGRTVSIPKGVRLIGVDRPVLIEGKARESRDALVVLDGGEFNGFKVIYRKTPNSYFVLSGDGSALVNNWSLTEPAAA